MKFQLKFIVFILLIINNIYNISNASAQNKNGGSIRVGFSKVEGYLLKPGLEPRSGYFIQLFSRKEQFDHHFIFDKAKKVKPINLKGIVVMVCAAPKSKLGTSIILDKIIKKAGVMEVYFIKKAGKSTTNLTTPFCMYSTGKDESLSGIDYYVDGKLEMDLRN